MTPRKTTEQFIEEAKQIHDDKYDYSKVKYINNRTKITIICSIHREFEQNPGKHLSGQGCAKCGGTVKKTTGQFIEEAKKIHRNKYNYSRVEYIDNRTKIIIICFVHGEFEQVPKSHLKGSGCSTCGIIERSKKRSSNSEQFIKKAKQIHGDRYDYGKVEYKNSKSKFCIIC